MTIIFLDINHRIYNIKCLIYNLAIKSYKIDTEKLETWEKASFSCPPESTNFAFIESLKNLPPTKIVSLYQTIWVIYTSLIILMNPIEIILIRSGDNKTHLRADIRCKWTPLSLQEEHFMATIFWIPNGSPWQVSGLLRIYSR